MGDWTYIESFTWHDEHGNEVLKHKKYRLPDGSKVMPWRRAHPNGRGGWVKGADGLNLRLLFNLPELLAAGRRAHCWIVEGESDVLALREHGILAVTHGGARQFTKQHAKWFRGWPGRITLARDNDTAGILDVLLRYDRLREVGIPARQLRIVRGRAQGKGADVRDHLDAGWGLDDFIREPVAQLRKKVANLTQEQVDAALAEAGYGYNKYTGYCYTDEWNVSEEDMALARTAGVIRP